MELTKSFSGSGRDYFAAKARVTKKGKLLIVLIGAPAGNWFNNWPAAWRVDDDGDEVVIYTKLSGDQAKTCTNANSKWATAAVRMDGHHVQIKLNNAVNRSYGYAFDL